MAATVSIFEIETASTFIQYVEAMRDERTAIENQIRGLQSDLERVCSDLQGVWQKRTFDSLACDMVDLDGVDPDHVDSAIEEIKRQLGG